MKITKEEMKKEAKREFRTRVKNYMQARQQMVNYIQKAVESGLSQKEIERIAMRYSTGEYELFRDEFRNIISVEHFLTENGLKEK